MAKALFIALAVILFVAVVAEMEFDDETTADVEFLKRDPDMQEYFLAEKRGKNLKKYKYCAMFNQDCWCSRRTQKIVYCTGAATGADM